MRITMISIGSRGDVQPMIALGVGLQAAGHQVRLATHANFEKEIRSRGLDFFQIEGNPQAIVESAAGSDWLDTGSNPIRFMRQFMRLAESMIDKLTRDCWNACQDAEAIIHASNAIYAAEPIARKLRIPL